MLRQILLGLFVLVMAASSLQARADEFDIAEDAISHGNHKIYRSRLSSYNDLSATYMKIARISYNNTVNYNSTSVAFKLDHVKRGVNQSTEGKLTIRKLLKSDGELQFSPELYYESVGDTHLYEEPVRVVKRGSGDYVSFEIWAYVFQTYDNVGSTLDFFTESSSDVELEMFRAREEGILGNGDTLVTVTGSKVLPEDVEIGGDLEVSKISSDSIDVEGTIEATSVEATTVETSSIRAQNNSRIRVAGDIYTSGNITATRGVTVLGAGELKVDNISSVFPTRGRINVNSNLDFAPGKTLKVDNISSTELDPINVSSDLSVTGDVITDTIHSAGETVTISDDVDVTGTLDAQSVDAESVDATSVEAESVEVRSLHSNIDDGSIFVLDDLRVMEEASFEEVVEFGDVLRLRAMSVAPSNPRLGDIFFNSWRGQAICVFINDRWDKMAGDGTCPAAPTIEERIEGLLAEIAELNAELEEAQTPREETTLLNRIRVAEMRVQTLRAQAEAQ